MSTTATDEAQSGTRLRARPMAPDERRHALVQCVIPLLKEHGRDVSTRQIAEACGVAEGTVFRAFGDKESLIAAAVEAYFDPQPFRDALGGIDAALPPEQKLGEVLRLLRERFAGVFGFMHAIGMRGGPPPSARQEDFGWADVVERLLEPDAAALAVPPQTIAQYLRLVAISSAIPSFSGPDPLEASELLALVTRGVLAPEWKG